MRYSRAVDPVRPCSGLRRGTDGGGVAQSLGYAQFHRDRAARRCAVGQRIGPYLGTGNPQIALLVVVALFFVFYVKRRHWREVDRSRAKHRLVAPGSGEDHGSTRSSFYVPLKRTRRMRRYAFILLLALPLLLDLVGMGKSSGLASLCAVGAALAGTAGIVIERWLFFTDTPTSGEDNNSVDLLV